MENFFGEVVFCQLFAIFSELTAWCHNLIHGVPQATPLRSFQSSQNMKNYFECLLAIFSEVSVLRHNLIYGVPKVASSVISPLFLKIWKAIFRKDSLLLEAKHFAPQPFSRCSQSNFFGNKLSFQKNMGDYF
ncbi:hypothetical protein [Enterococcus thailandicus]